MRFKKINKFIQPNLMDAFVAAAMAGAMFLFIAAWPADEVLFWPNMQAVNLSGQTEMKLAPQLEGSIPDPLIEKTARYWHYALERSLFQLLPPQFKVTLEIHEITVPFMAVFMPAQVVANYKIYAADQKLLWSQTITTTAQVPWWDEFYGFARASQSVQAAVMLNIEQFGQKLKTACPQCST